MSKKKPRGICRICGEYKKLTYEHVPPGATFNKQSVRFVSLKDYVEAEKQESTMPWELDKIKGKINQRGRGGYYICENCNNNTGSWYGGHYKKFIDALMYVITRGRGKDYKSVVIELTEMRPLPIIKQIMTMFCDINENLAADDSGLKAFILNKAENGLDLDKYRVFMYLLKNEPGRTAPLSTMIRLGDKDAIVVSEISGVPVGFLLYYDLSEGYNPPGTEITNFAQCGYDENANITLTVNVFENNTMLPSDFRSREEIKAQIERSTSWEAEHKLVEIMRK